MKFSQNKTRLPNTLFTFFILLFSLTFLAACGGDDEGGGNEPAIFDASGRWAFTFTETKKVDGDFIECGDNPDLKRSFTITQNGNEVSLADKNEEVVLGSVSGASYVFDFKEMDNNFDEDFISFRLNFNLSSETNFSGTYRMDERTFFTADNITFFCITEGTLSGSKSGANQ